MSLQLSHIQVNNDSYEVKIKLKCAHENLFDFAQIF
jgi:hypothetical protein